MHSDLYTQIKYSAIRSTIISLSTVKHSSPAQLEINAVLTHKQDQQPGDSLNYLKN